MKRIVITAACFFSLAQASQRTSTQETHETYQYLVSGQSQEQVSDKPLELVGKPDANNKRMLYLCPFCTSKTPSLLSNGLSTHVRQVHLPLRPKHHAFLTSVSNALKSKEIPNTVEEAYALIAKHNIQSTHA